MRIACSLLALSALAGCASVLPPQAWTWDGTPPRPRPAVTAEAAASVAAQAAPLQQQKSEIRNRISAERDVHARQRLYEELHQVGMRLSPLERKLAGFGE